MLYRINSYEFEIENGFIHKLTRLDEKSWTFEIYAVHPVKKERVLYSSEIVPNAVVEINFSILNI